MKRNEPHATASIEFTPDSQQSFRVTLYYQARQIEHEYGVFETGERGYKRWEVKSTAGLSFDLPEGRERLFEFLNASGGASWLLSDLDSEESTVYPDEVSDEGGGGNGGAVFTDDGEESEEEIDCDGGEIVVIRREAHDLPQQIELLQGGNSATFSTIDEFLRWMHVPLASRLDIARSGNVAVSLSPDYEFVRSEVQRSALLGDLVAMRLHAYELRDEENSLEAAFEWFLRAAESGDVDSMAELGRSFFHGDGVEEDLSAARRYLSAAVKLGHPDAHGWLGDLEAEGHGEVPGHAREIYERGADLGDPRSQYRLGVLLIETSDLRKDQLRGVRLVKQASDWGLHMAMLLRAERLLEGGLITKDEGEAKSVLEAAAADGCAKAWTILGEIWDFLGDDLDADEARYAYERGVEAGCPWAHWRLADFLMKIDVVGEHKSLRYALYLIAAENGVDQARRNLWALHKKGIGTPDERKRFENLPPESE